MSVATRPVMYDTNRRSGSSQSRSEGADLSRTSGVPGKQTLTSQLPPPPAMATAAASAATAAPAAATGTSPVPPEVLARIGAEFLHADDTSAVRSYRITPGGGFLLIAASDGTGVGKLEFRNDNKYKDAWTTLAAYVAKNHAVIPPTTAEPAPAPGAPEEAAPPADPSAFEQVTGAIGDGLAAVGDTLAGAVESGLTLIGGGVQAITDAIAGFIGVAPTAPATGETPAAPETGVTPEPGTGHTPAPDAPARQPTTTMMVESVGTGGANQIEDVTLVQHQLSQLGYTCTATGSLDDATVRAIGQYQAARVAHGGALSTNLVAQVDGLISKGGATEKSLFGNTPMRFTPMQPGSVKPNQKESESAGATGEARTHWDNILAVWSAVSPYLPAASHLTSGYRSYDDQVRVIEDFFIDDYKAAIIAAHGQAEWQALVGKTDDASVSTKLDWVRACGQDVARPGSSPHQSGHAIDVGGADDTGQIHALLRYHVDVDKSKVTKVLHEKNGCVHFEFA
jgi:D-alanyl-D-alanine carboxypeptidase/Putative peptidoglycan binding domain